MTSKYAIALYEMICLRSNLDMCLETIDMEKFRELLGVPPGAYDRTDNFMRFVIKPAVLEVNGLSDTGVRIDMVRKHPRAMAHAATIGWWRKSAEELAAVARERNRSKVGRMSRLKGTAARTITALDLPPLRSEA
jgi:plasmid replication initiation protein